MVPLEDMEGAAGVDNLAYHQPRQGELKLNFMAPPEPAQQPNDGSRNPHIDDGGYFQTLNNTNGGSDNFYPVVASNSQSEV